jgi:chloride channel 7
VIMVEISDDVHMLLPVLVAIMVAKWVADAATHSLYHALLEVKCAPFLVSLVCARSCGCGWPNCNSMQRKTWNRLGAHVSPSVHDALS